MPTSSPRQSSATDSAKADGKAVDALLRASRALVGIAAQSLDLPDDVTLPQFRVLVLLASRGEQRVGELAIELAVHPSTATRMVDRLEAKRLVHRVTPRGRGEDRREMLVQVESAGAALVARVNRRRRRALAEIVDRLPRRQRGAVTAAMTAFADVAGEVADSSWELGWELA
jgi:DNA-binding MarR family transcriptional regulator